MSVRPIVTLGDPRLRLKGKPVDAFGKYLHELLDDLAHTMRDAPGVGLAAPSWARRCKPASSKSKSTLYELVNPRIVRATGDDRDLEGCLSIPGLRGLCRRGESGSGSSPRTGTARSSRSPGSGCSAGHCSTSSTTSTGKLYIDYLDSMDELIPVGAGRRGRGRGPRGDERPGVTDGTGTDRLHR